LIKKDFTVKNRLGLHARPAALFVQVIPRANWGKLKLDDASDLGFLRVDPQKRELLFEGDNEQYRVPGAAITSCEIEVFVSGQGTHGATTLYRVVLQANHPSGFWEVPIAQRGAWSRGGDPAGPAGMTGPLPSEGWMTTEPSLARTTATRLTSRPPTT